MREFTGGALIGLILLIMFSPTMVGKLAARVEAGYHAERDSIYGKPEAR